MAKLKTLRPGIGVLGSQLKTLKPTRAKGDSWRSNLAKTSERGYGWKWQKARASFLSKPENVLCRMCEAEGYITAATVVDHIVPHKGDQSLFWNTSNWQPLCKPHHDGAKAREEGRGGGGPALRRLAS